MKRLQTARIDWQTDVPVSEAFGDVYFNRDGGAAETRYVFLEGNGLPERFRELAPYDTFTVGETGFGTGLNFFCAREAFLAHAPVNTRLHFISFELFPLSPADMRHALTLMSMAAPVADSFMAQYPPAMTGHYQLFLDQGRVQLTLVLGDLLETLPQLQAEVDCWFLDGFAPSCNPHMWQDSVFQELARLSHSATTLATFTVARCVRDGLNSAGFTLSKRKGFGRKRDMLCARATTAKCRTQRPQQVVVIGAGLAGASTARALAERGIAVTLLERHHIASGGSGNAQGALYIKPAVEMTAATQLHLHGYHYTCNRLQPLDDPDLAELCGVLQPALSAKAQRHQQQLLASNLYPAEVLQPMNAMESSVCAGTEIRHAGLFYPRGGWVSPPRWCDALLQHPLIELHTQTPVRTLHFDPQQQRWQVESDVHTFAADAVVVCCADQAPTFAHLAHLPLQPIRGQTSLISADGLPQLNCVVCAEGYISPPRQGHYCFGASFRPKDSTLDERPADHSHNLDLLCEALPAFAPARERPWRGRAGLRCGAPDYLPLVGAVAEKEAFIAQYARLRVDANWRTHKPTPLWPGLYVNAGHGSKGLITCPISAELIAAQISGGASPLPLSLQACLDPNRFLVRDLKRRRI